MNYRGVALVRVSTEEQANEAEGRAGLLRQRNDVHVTSQTWNIEVVEKIEITDVSGTCVMESPKFRHMLDILKQPTIDCLVVSSLDRLMRPNDFTAFSIFDIFLSHRKLIFTATGPPIDVAEDPGFIQVLIGGMLAGIERKTMLRRIQTAKEENRKRGRHANPKRCLPKGIDFDFKTARWSWVEPYASRIKDAFALILQGFSMRYVARRLGYATNTLRKQLMNPTWTGYREYKERCVRVPSKDGRQGRKKKVPREKPLRVAIEIDPIISQEDFLRVQEILNAHQREWTSDRSRGSPFELLGIARCICGQKFYATSKKNRHDGIAYYVCRGRQLKAGCRKKRLRREELEYAVQAFIATFFGEPDVVRSLLAKRSPDGTPPHLKHCQQLEEARTELNRVNDQMTRLLNLTVKGLFPKEQVEAEARRINSEVAAWNTAIHRLEREIHSVATASESEVALAISSVFAEFEFLQQTERKELLRKFVSAVYVDDGNITKVIVRLPEVAKMSRHIDVDAQFHDSIEIPIALDYPFRTSLPVQFNKFGIPEKKQYRSGDVAKVLGISGHLLRSRFRNGVYPDDMPKDSVGRVFSIRDIEHLVSITVSVPRTITKRKSHTQHGDPLRVHTGTAEKQYDNRDVTSAFWRTWIS